MYIKNCLPFSSEIWLHSCACIWHVHTTLTMNEKLDHIPSSCIVVLLVLVVKGHQYTCSTHLIDVCALIAEMESEIDSRPQQGLVSMLQSQEMNSIAQYSFRTLDRSWHDACYILILFIHTAKRMREVRPVVLIRESST